VDFAIGDYAAFGNDDVTSAHSGFEGRLRHYGIDDAFRRLGLLYGVLHAPRKFFNALAILKLGRVTKSAHKRPLPVKDAYLYFRLT
jgi:hypothetical protein